MDLRIRYEHGRPYTVPETLEELTGPTGASSTCRSAC
jgi:hypothetical protein